MPNKLKDVFSNKMFEIGGNLSFRDVDAHNKFLDALRIVHDEGRTVAVEGVSAISTNVKDGSTVYPLMVESVPTQFVVGPSIEPVSITVDTDCGKKTVNFQRYETSKEVMVENSSNEIVFLKFAFLKGGHQVKFTCRMQSKFAKNAKDVADSFCTAIGVLNQFFKPDSAQSVSSDFEALQTIKQSFKITYSFWKKLNMIQDELSLSFDPAKIENIDDNVRDVEELYLLLIEKKAVRLDAKLTPTESTGITLKPSEYAPEIGQTIDLTFTGEIAYSICEQDIKIYTANLLSNAIIKEITECQDGTTKILYDDADSAPMYISCTGHKTPDEALEENALIIRDKERTKKYKEAVTANEYYKLENPNWYSSVYGFI